MSPDASEQLDVATLMRAERERLVRQIAELTDERDAIVESAAANPPDDEHDAEGSTVGFERARVSALLEHALRRLSELEAAFGQLGEGERRVCEACAGPIPVERLAALPETRRCADCAARTGRRTLRLPSR